MNETTIKLKLMIAREGEWANASLKWVRNNERSEQICCKWDNKKKANAHDHDDDDVGVRWSMDKKR